LGDTDKRMACCDADGHKKILPTVPPPIRQSGMISDGDAKSGGRGEAPHPEFFFFVLGRCMGGEPMTECPAHPGRV